MPIAKKRNRRQSVRTRRNLAAFFEPLEDRRLMAVVQPGFSESIYKSALPTVPTAITIDAASRDIYYAEPNTNGVLRKIAADAGRTLTTVTSDFTPPSAVGAVFPFNSTDIQYHAGAVYTVISNNAIGHLVRIDTANGLTTVLQSVGGSGYEAGVEVVTTPDAIYFTDGQGTANSLFRFSLTTGGVTTVVSNLPPNSVGLELNPADGKLYFARQGEGLFRVDENAGGPATITQISNHPTGVGNFAIDPLGEHIYVRVGGNINRISLATGAIQVFATGLQANNGQDLAFGPSSNGSGFSLYAGNENTLLEYTGFVDTSVPPQPGEIGGSKWDDLDGDGVRDASEPGLANLVVYLDANRDGQLNAGETQTTTDASGNYRFENVQPGHYVVREVIPAGYRQTSPGANRDFYYGWDGIQQALVTIDAVTGDVSTGIPTLSVPLHGIAQTNDGQLYAINGGTDALYRIDSVSGSTTLVGPTGVQLAFGLAYDPQEDVLYGLATPPAQPTGTVQLVRFNRSTGQVTFVGSQPTAGLTGTSGITFDAVGRRVIAFDNADDEIYAFDPQSGVGSRLAFARPALGTFGLSQDGKGNLVFQTSAFLGRINLTTGQHSPFLPLSRPVTLEALELVDFEEFGHRVTVGSGGIVSGIDFGNQSILSTLSGSKWEDLDGDGTRDSGEPAMAGVVVFLDANNNGTLDSGETQTTTGADGSYIFTGLIPGRYTVREVLPENYRQTSPGKFDDFFWAYDTVGHRIAKVDAATGAVTPIGGPGSIGINVDIHGLAYTKDGELYGISGSNNALYRIDTTTGQATQLRGTGMPLAWGLAYDAATDTLYGLATPPGFTTGNVQPVIFNRQSGGATFIGSQVTSGLTGTSGLAFDSVSGKLIAFDNSDDEVYSFDVTTGVGTRLGVSGSPLNSGAMADDGAGNVILPTGGGLVRMNLSTRQVTPLTGPLAGVSIEALELVRHDDFAHTVYVGPAESIAGVNFGNQNVAGRISGTKWEDLDGDGVRDEGEPAMAGVVVYLDTNRDGDLDANEPQAITDASGVYEFTSVLPGSYLVREVVPENYRQTSPGVQRDFFWAFDWQNRNIVKIDALTGQVTAIGGPGSIGTGGGVNMHGLVQTNDGTLYGISGADNRLYQIDTTTGLATAVGPTGAVLAWGLAYDDATDTIYGAGRPVSSPQGNLQLLTIDRNTGAATYVGGQVATGISSTTGMTFDSATGKVLLHDRNTGRFFSIDPTTGVFTQFAMVRSFGTNGMASDGAGQVIVQQGGSLVRYNPVTGVTSTIFALAPNVAIDSLELIDFTEFAHEVFLGPAEQVTGIDFGNQNVLGSISGVKWEDLDGDGVRDPDEPAMPNVVIYLDANNNGQLDAGETQTTTDADGNYSFTGLLPGSHVVREVLLTGYEQTSPGVQRDFFYAMDAGSRRVVKIDALTGQITPLSAVYGSALLTGIASTSSGRVYGLGNDNALYSVDPESGEPTRIGFSGRSQLGRGLAYDRNTDTLYGLADVGGGRLGLVKFDLATGVATNAGDASIQANAAGIGGLTFEPVSGEVWALDNTFFRFLAFNTTTGAPREVQTVPFLTAGNLANDGKGNLLVMTGPILRRINPNTGETFQLLSTSQFIPIESLELQDFDAFAHRFYLAPAGNLSDLNFANRSIVSSLSGVKYHDRNGDGVRQADEPGLGGVTVYLDLNFDNQLSPDEPTTVTSADGSYSFANLLPGRYVVREIVPEGYAPSPLTELEDYYLGYDQGARELVTIDPTTGEVTTKVTLVNPPSLNGMVRTNSNEIFALSGPGNAFYKIDTATGEVSLVGSAQRLVAWGLAYDAVTDTIYGLAHPNADLEQLALVRYDRTTGEAIILGEPIIGARFTSGITFDPVRRKVLAYDNSSVREIYAFDPETGAGELLSVVDPPVGGYGLATDNAGYLILSAGPSSFIRIDPVTGAWSPHLTLSREVGLEALEFIDFADGGHDVYLAPRTDYVGYDFGNQNVAPADLQLTLAQSVSEGSPLELTGSFVDPGSFESHTIEITWGDGTVETIALAPGVLTFTASHTYVDDDPTGTASDPYNVRVRVLDSDAGEASAEQTVEVLNAAPSQLVLIGDSGIDENDTASLSITFADAGVLDTHSITIDWGDGFTQQIDLSTGSYDLLLTHQYLDDPASAESFVITVTIVDDDGGQAFATHEVSVLNVAPHLAPIAGPGAAVRGQEVTFSSEFSDPGTLDSYEVSWDFGDGTVLPFSAIAPGALLASHVYKTAGSYTVTLTLRDDDGGISTQQFQIQVGVAMLQADPLNPGEQMLVIGGTTGDDVLLVLPWFGGRVEVLVNDQLLGPFLPQSRIVLYGQDGDDLITSLVSKPTWMYGGDGDDILLGGPGDNVLLGEDGDDQLAGGSGDDVMVGGRGEDRLVGSSGSDLLIAGFLSQITEAELGEVQSTWTSSATYQNRIATLSPILNNQTVIDDAARDMLTGSSGLDWYFAELDRGGGQVEDKITGSIRDEELVDLLANLAP